MRGELISLDEARRVSKVAEYDRLEADDTEAVWANQLGDAHDHVFSVVTRPATAEECAAVRRPGARLCVVTVAERSRNGGSQARFVAEYRVTDRHYGLGALAALQDLTFVGFPPSVFDLPVRGRSC